MIKTVTDTDDEIGMLGILLGHFENGTGLTEAGIYARLVELQREAVE